MRGKDISVARASLLLSLRELSSLTGIDRRALKRLEGSDEALSQEHAYALAPYVGILELTNATKCRLIRQRTNMTQEELGTILEKSARWVSAFENGHVEASAFTLSVINALLGE